MIKNLDIGNEIIDGVKDVFSTMLMVEVSSGEIVTGEVCDIQSNLTGMIGLGGGLCGLLAVHCPGQVAKAITGAMLGMEIDELDEDVEDAIGEIANMIAGNVKASCAGIGINVELAIPTSIIGDSFHVSGRGESVRVVVPFAMADDHFWVEMQYVLSG